MSQHGTIGNLMGQQGTLWDNREPYLWDNREPYGTIGNLMGQ